MISAIMRVLAAARIRCASASCRLVTSSSDSPLRGSGRLITACCASGHSDAASASAAAIDTISPPILAKRLARPRMVTNPAPSTETMSPVSYQPSRRRLQHAGRSLAQIAQHHVRPAHEQPAAGLDAGHRLEPVQSMPGRKRPTVPGRQCIAVFSASTGAVSVAP